MQVSRNSFFSIRILCLSLFFEKNMLGNSKINSKLWASKINVPAAKPSDLSSFSGTYMVEVESQE